MGERSEPETELRCLSWNLLETGSGVKLSADEISEIEIKRSSALAEQALKRTLLLAEHISCHNTKLKLPRSALNMLD